MVGRSAAVLAVLVTLALPAAAAAQPGYSPAPTAYGAPPAGPTLGAWVGIGFPGGDLSSEGDGALGDVVSHQFPIGLALGWRFHPMLRAGGFFEAAPLAMTGSACAPGDPCGGADFRLGLEAQLHLAPYRRADPWVGLGFGYEWLRFDATGCDAAGSCFAERFRYSGWLFPRLSAGLDLAVTPLATVGPYLAWSGGQYADVHTTSAGSQSIRDQAFHGWFELGIRGTLGF